MKADIASILVLALSPLASYASAPTQHPVIIGAVPDNNLLLILIIVVIAVAIAVAGLVVYFKKLKKKTAKKVKFSPSSLQNLFSCLVPNA